VRRRLPLDRERQDKEVRKQGTSQGEEDLKKIKKGVDKPQPL
jgi:hypothetical protein